MRRDGPGPPGAQAQRDIKCCDWEGMEALQRAKQRRETALAAQTERMTAEKAAIAKAHESAKHHGLVEKTAGESGAAGKLRNKWAKWLASPHGDAVAARLGAEGGAPTVEEAKLLEMRKAGIKVDKEVR